MIDNYAENLDNYRKLIFIPHGSQWNTPYSVIKHPKTDKLLLETHQVILEPSLRYCKIQDRKMRFETKKCLLIGDPTNDLPNSKTEIQEISKYLDADILIGKQAKKGRIIDLLKKNEYDIIHYSGHGVIPLITGQGKFIVNDGTITDEEILNCNVRANIFNIASCWGGTTTFSVWNELKGFPRTILTSDIRNMICSSFPISDEAAKDFSINFYNLYSQNGQSPVEAFKNAIISIHKDYLEAEWGGLFISGKRN